ncbi:hypothetical protein [Salmonirosea aquatica]|uniref:Tetratricopeptide repeat protein n=1 Tax=Salmonirosea aquatica TaxID=2654236 RepID=A0A7C9FQ64_9BACT|nr:hypothetical protein [Cytophagaceae bacterium SJW1-29]
MTTVDKETFAYWVTHPHDIGAPNLARLEATAQAYPYCQITYTLMAKVGADIASPRLTELLPLAAIHTLNRSALRHLIEGEFAWSDSLLNRMTDLSPGRHLSDRDSRTQAVSQGSGKPTLLPYEELSGTSETPVDDSLPSSPPVDDRVMSEKVIEEELTYKRLKPTSIPMIALLPLPKTREDDRRKQQEIIEAFIKNDPRIGPIRNQPNEQTTQTVDLSQRATAPPLAGMVTESFAKILTKQGKLDKAVEIYEKLMVKNPEKRDYFAEKIAELREENQ